MQRGFDFDIQGVVGIRLIDPTPGFARSFAKRFGPYQTALQREPDITIRFQSEISHSGLKLLGLQKAAFSDDGFFLLSSHSGVVEAKIPFEAVGDRCEILCRSDVQSVPLLLDIVKLTFLKKGYVPLHASAFMYKECGVLVLGWEKGGKTEALLSFANHGAQYVGDEWVIVSADGEQMFGIPVPIAIREWQFKYLRFFSPKIGLQRRAIFRGIHLLDAIYRAFWLGKDRSSFFAEALNRALPVLKNQLKVTVPPQIMFQSRDRSQGVALDKLFLIMSAASPEVMVEPGNPLDIAERMVTSNMYEQQYFLKHYHAFKFAFPESRNELIEQGDVLQRELLRRAFADKEAYTVLHPYPVAFERLFQRMKPYC
ncbi:MAG: hypothetical protein JSV66_12345, partial [Trueperaceae bacterium]